MPAMQEKKQAMKNGVATAASTPILFHKGLIHLRDLKNKSIELSWQLQKTDKKQSAILSLIEKRLRLIALDEFWAELQCERLANKTYYLSGKWSARVRQQCVVSLDEFDDTLTGEPHLDFIEERFYDEKKHKEVEPIAGDDLDTLEQMVQELSLSLDLFPKKPGAAIPSALRAELQEATAELSSKEMQAVQGQEGRGQQQELQAVQMQEGQPQQHGQEELLRPTKPFANLAMKLKQKYNDR